jgi:hypothetical protein
MNKEEEKEVMNGSSWALYHNSSDTRDILVIYKNEGIFGGIFSAHNGPTGTGGNNVFEFILDASTICEDEMLLDVKYDNKLEEMCPDLSEDERHSIITGECIPDDVTDGELGWEMQRIRGELASKFGWKAVSMIDETGTSYLILEGIGKNVTGARSYPVWPEN